MLRKHFLLTVLLVLFVYCGTTVVIDCEQLQPMCSRNPSALFCPHERTREYKYFGANVVRKTDGAVAGICFRVWLPNARRVEVIGDFNDWQEGGYPMRNDPQTGNWAVFIPAAKPGTNYKFKILDAQGRIQYRNDPYARFVKQDDMDFEWESVVIDPDRFRWSDQAYEKRDRRARMNIMEIYPGTLIPGRPDANFREIAEYIVALFRRFHYTTASFMPVNQHNVKASWGYQAGSLFSVDHRHGTPDDFKYLVNRLHENGIDVVIDLVHSHASRDWNTGLGGIDGTNLYFDDEMGIHPHWDTYYYDYDRPAVRDFLLSNALYWIDEFHVDGFRLDAVASMLYLDYGRAAGEWTPAPDGTKWNYGAIDYIKTFNRETHRANPKTITIAEESSGYPNVTSTDGLGFDYKWDLGGMHHIREFLKLDPGKRDLVLISEPLRWDAKSINYVNSHDEVAKGGRFYVDLIGEQDDRSRFAIMRNIEVLTSIIYPGQQMSFVGDQFANRGWWDEKTFADIGLRSDENHQRMERFTAEKNLFKLADGAAALENAEKWSNRELIIDNENQIGAWARLDNQAAEQLIVVQSYNPENIANYRIPAPDDGEWEIVFNTDDRRFGGRGTAAKASSISRRRGETVSGSHFIEIQGLPAYSTLILERKGSRRPPLHQPSWSTSAMQTYAAPHPGI